MEYQNYSSPTEPTDLFQQEIFVYGNFWERFLASLIDGVILIIPNILLEVIVDGVESTLISIAIGWIYCASMESGRSQATFGKRAMGLKVTDLNANPISFGQATARHFGKYLSMLILCIGYLMMLWDDKNQTLHDKMANTLIIKNRTSW
ncbi:MAG: RDD family protein [Flavisolibacter sp.]